MTTAPEGFVAPDFDDDSDRKLCIICSKGTLDMAYPGLIMANGALEEGMEVHLFFTFWGLDVIRKKTVDKLTITPVGNTAMRLPGTSLAFPQLVGTLPGMLNMSSWMMKRKIAGIDVPTVRDFIGHVADAGAHLWACKMSVDMMELTDDDFIDEVEETINVTRFLELSEGAQVLFV